MSKTLEEKEEETDTQKSTGSGQTAIKPPSSGSSPTIAEKKEGMRFAPSDVRQWDFRVSRIGGWLAHYPKEDTVAPRLAMDTMAQDLYTRRAN